MAFADGQTNGVIKYSSDSVMMRVEETVKVGDCLGFSGGWKRALATVGSLIQQRCVALQDGEAEQEVPVCFGIVVISGERLSGGTRGNALYVAEGTSNGKYTETAPTTTGDANKIVGYMITATEAVLNPNAVSDSVA